MRVAFQCPHCDRAIIVGIDLAAETRSAPPSIAPPKAKEKVRHCACGHPKDMHSGDAGPCTYGHGHAMGGCTCERYHSRRQRIPVASAVTNGAAFHVGDI